MWQIISASRYKKITQGILLIMGPNIVVLLGTPLNELFYQSTYELKYNKIKYNLVRYYIENY